MATVGKLWDVIIYNNTAEPRIVYMEGTITSNTRGKLYVARTPIFQIQSGSQELRSAIFSPIRIQFSVFSNKTHKILDQEDSYEYVTRVVDAKTGEVLKEIRNQWIPRPPAVADIDTILKKKRDSSEVRFPVKFEFSANISNRYTFPNQENTYLPNYTRATINPRLTIADIPIQARAIMSTERGANGQKIDEFNIQFDANAYKNILLEKTIKEIDKIEDNRVTDKLKYLESLKVEDIKGAFDNYQKWIEKLKDPEVQKRLMRLENLKHLEKVSNNPQFKAKLDKLAKYEKVLSIRSVEDLKKIKDELSEVRSIEDLKQIKNTYQIPGIDKIKTQIGEKLPESFKRALSGLSSLDIEGLERLRDIKTIEDIKKIQEQLDNIALDKFAANKDVQQQIIRIKNQISTLDIDALASITDENKFKDFTSSVSASKQLFSAIPFNDIIKEKMPKRFILAMEELASFDIKELGNLGNIHRIEDVRKIQRQLQKLNIDEWMPDEGKRKKWNKVKSVLINTDLSKIEQFVDRSKWTNLERSSGQLQAILSSVENVSPKIKRIRKKIADLDISSVKDLRHMSSIEDMKKVEKILTKHASIWKDNRGGRIVEFSNQMIRKKQAIETLKKEVLDIKIEEYEQLLDLEKQVKNIRKARKQLMENKSGEIVRLRNKKAALERLQSTNYTNLLSSSSRVKKIGKHIGALSKKETWLGSVERMSFWNVYPQYSDLVLNSLRIKGYDVAINPSLLYIASAGGQVENQLLDTARQKERIYRRNLFAIKAGIGSEQNNHIHFMYMISRDKDKKSIDSTELQQKSTPQENHVFGLQMQGAVWKNRIRAKAIMAYSLFNENKLAYKKIINPNTIKDWALKADLELHLFNKNTLFSATFQHVGPQFISFGVPFLIDNQSSYELRWEQMAYKRYFHFSSYFRQGWDNLRGTQTLRTYTTSFGGFFSIRVPKYPYIQVNLASVFVQSDKTAEWQNRTNNKTMVVNATLGHTYQVKKTSMSTQLTYTNQQSLTDVVAINNDGGVSLQGRRQQLIAGHTMQASHSMHFPFPLVWQTDFSLGISPFQSANIAQRIFQTTMILTTRAVKKMTNTFGINHAGDDVNNQKFEYYWQISIPFLKHFYFDTRIQGNSLRDIRRIGASGYRHSITFFANLSVKF